MDQMAQDTAGVRNKLVSEEKTTQMLRSRMEEIQEQNSGLLKMVSGREAEIRQLNDQINELMLKVRVAEGTNGGLISQIKNQSESEAIVVQAQRQNMLTLENLTERYNKLLQENENLRVKWREEKELLESEYKKKLESAKEDLEVFNKEKDKYVLKTAYQSLEDKYAELDGKHRKLLKLRFQLGPAEDHAGNDLAPQSDLMKLQHIIDSYKKIPN
jgi:chromosome segregation ATPase